MSFGNHQLEAASNAYQGTVELDKKGVAPDIGNPFGLSLPMTEDNTTQMTEAHDGPWTVVLLVPTPPSGEL